MNRMWDILMRPIIEAIGASYIVEVGSEKGTSTQNILEYCVENDAHMVAIDPFPQFDVDEFKEEYGDRFEIFSELSLSSLPLLKDYDVILIDGDHNWYTVYNELKIIERTFENKKFPLVFLHDVGWPYGRRDLYYDPDNIPAVYRQPYKKLGMYPGKAYLLEEGGLNRGYCNSIYQNNLRNGVLTAVEDFVKESELEFSFEHIDLYHGLGILHLKDNELETIIKEVIKSANLLNKVEEERIKLQIEYTQSKKNLISLENQLKKSQEQNANFKRLEDDYEVSKNYNKSLENKIKEAKLVLKPTTDQLELLFNYAKLKQGIIRDMGEREVELRSQVDDLVFELYEMDYNSNKSFFSRFPSLYILFSGIKNDRSLRNIFANIKGYRAIKENDLFDVGYYLKNNSDVRSSYRDPLIHYIFNGFKEGRKPGPSFNGDFYLRKHADVRESNLNPLVHYSLYGIKENRKTKTNKVVYTVITGDYDDLLTPEHVNDDWDYVCFTDNMNLSSDFWEIREMEGFNLDNIRKNRIYKILPHIFLPEYDYSLYIDGNFRIIGDIDEYITRFLKNNHMLCFIHPERNCIYEEAQTVLKMGKDSEKFVSPQINKYKSENYPKNNGLIAGGILFRKHNNPPVVKIMNAWWRMVEFYSRRDQLSFNYVCWKYDFNFDMCNLSYWDNEYFERLPHVGNKT